MIQYSKNQKIKPYTTSAFIPQDTEFAKLCLKRPCDRMNLLILRRKSRSAQNRGTIFESDLNALTQHKISDVKLSMS